MAASVQDILSLAFQKAFAEVLQISADEVDPVVKQAAIAMGMPSARLLFTQ